jgi:hypothetical protein
MLAGMWILVLLPLMDALFAFRWARHVPVPPLFDVEGTLGTLNETFVSSPGVYQPLIFCIGVVLLFAKERGRRRGPLDWTRRWGILCSYVVLLLSAVQILFITALVATGIAALFLSMPLKYQPGITQNFVEVSTTYLRYGPYPRGISYVVLVAFSSITILLACCPLYDALRSSGPKRLAAILLAPLALFSLMHLAQAGRYCVGIPGATAADVYRYAVYFCPDVLVKEIPGLPASLKLSGSDFGAFLVEAAKWCIVLAIAVWLSIAQLAAGFRRLGEGAAG